VSAGTRHSARTPLVLYDDTIARGFEPFALTRPAGELRAGAELVRRRWERVTAAGATGFIGAAHLGAFEEFDAPPAAHGTLAAGTIVANTRCAVALDASPGDTNVTQWTCGGRVAAVRLSAPLDVARLASGELDLATIATGATGTIAGWWIDDVWHLVGKLGVMMAADIAVLARGATDVPAHVTVLGEHAALVEPGAYMEPYVLADTTGGAVLVRRGARVSAFTRLVGPCIIGEDAQVGGGKIRECSIGEQARVHGEMSNTIVIGHANKAHDGFIGHSVIGRWANLGAGTITSNLKNSYGEVSLWTPAGTRRTGETFLGAMIGDHAKLGIGTRLTTGTVVGAGANVFGTAMPPKFVPPFAWGDGAPFDEFKREQFLAVAARVMARRGVTLGDAGRATLSAAWERRALFT
jgi:UDP-N-acetylglucosamine diphosphorylase/glucosamine-1-phosphate N-acetyltransferase